MYNVTNITNSNSILDLYVAVNQLSSGFLTTAMLVAMWFIIFIVFKKQPIGQVIFGSSFIMSIITIYFFTLQMVGWAFPSFVIVVFFGSMFYNLFAGD